MKDLLLEIYSEEIPAKMQIKAAEDIKILFTQYMQQNNLSFKTMDSYVSARRLTIAIFDIPEFIESEVVSVKGPRIDANPAAIDGFVSSNKISKEDLIIKNIGDKQYYFYEEHRQQISAGEVLARMIPEILTQFPWRNVMRWGMSKIKWVRPIKNILCIFGDNILNFTFGHLKANNYSFGHRFINPEQFIVTDISQYKKELEKRHVVFDQNIRKELILNQCKDLAKQHNLTFVEDEHLLAEVCGLVEYPNSLLGTIDQKYMVLPKEVIITSMKLHQKYFCLEKNNLFQNYFITITNILHDNDNIVIRGNEKVLSARLEDAMFFWQKDLLTDIIEHASKLKNVIFHQKLGSIEQKISRMTAVAKYISSHTYNCDLADIEVATKLSKADLVTEMVGEFPELQGVIGKYYALSQSYKQEIANAIEEHYKPISQNDHCPTGNLSIIVSIADKIDSIVGLWIAGEKPTGSKDPYALRRYALALIKLILEKEINIDLNDLVKISMKSYKDQNIKFEEDNILSEIISFIGNRFVVYIKALNIRQDIILSVVSKFNNIYTAFLKITAISNFLNNEKNIAAFQSYNRAVKMINAEEKKDQIEYVGNVNESIIKSQDEMELFSAILGLKKQIDDKVLKLDYDQALSYLFNISKPIDNFFDNVVVNDDNKDVRRNRLLLLSKIRQLFHEIFDISLIEN